MKKFITEENMEDYRTDRNGVYTTNLSIGELKWVCPLCFLWDVQK